MRQIDVSQLTETLKKANLNLSREGLYRKMIMETLNEIKIHHDLQHPHIIELIGYSVNKDFLVVTELCTMDLESFVFNRSVSPAQVLEFLR